MTSLVETLYPLPDLRRTPLSLLVWWESRRLKYNIAVGSAGLITLSCVLIVSIVLPGMQMPPAAALLGATAAYALLANACYTLGWFTELVARLCWGNRAPLMGPLLFREGLIFSVGLTLLPILVLVLVTLLQLVGLVM